MEERELGWVVPWVLSIHSLYLVFIPCQKQLVSQHNHHHCQTLPNNKLDQMLYIRGHIFQQFIPSSITTLSTSPCIHTVRAQVPRTSAEAT